jgi:hypothetical protein
MQYTVLKFPKQNNLQIYSMGMKITTSQQKNSRTTITETPGENTHTTAQLPQPVYSAL